MRPLLLFALLLTSSAAFAEWQQFADRRDNDLGMTLYYEPESLIMGASRYAPHGAHRLKKPKVSILVIFSKSKPQFAWRATKFLWEANCKSDTVRLLASTDLTQMGGDDIHVAQEPYMEWMAVNDDGVKNSVYNLLCKNIKLDAK